MTFSPCSDSQPGKLADCSSTSLSIHHCPVPMHPAELPSSPYPSLHIYSIHLKPQTPSSKLPCFPVWVFANRKGSLIAPCPHLKTYSSQKTPSCLRVSHRPALHHPWPPNQLHSLPLLLEQPSKNFLDLAHKALGDTAMCTLFLYNL